MGSCYLGRVLTNTCMRICGRSSAVRRYVLSKTLDKSNSHILSYTHNLIISIKSGGGNQGPMKPSNRQTHGANSPGQVNSSGRCACWRRVYFIFLADLNVFIVISPDEGYFLFTGGNTNAIIQRRKACHNSVARRART